MKVVARHRVLLAMTVLVGAASFFVGNAYQAQMPGFARDLNVGGPTFRTARSWRRTPAED